MHIQRLDPARLTEAYNIKCQFVYPWEGVVTPPFGGGWAVVEPGKETKHHNHQEGETFIIVQGQGEMRIGDETVAVGPGTVVYQPPYDGHVIRNTSETENLVFFGLYWEDRTLWEGRRESQVLAAERPRRALVTAAPPTPNGSIHLGHLSGPYLAADVLTRYLRLRGVDAAFGCGTDDHFSHVKTRAEELGLPPRESADRLARDIAASFQAAGIVPDLFLGPTAPAYRELVLDFFRQLHADGKLIEKEAPSPFCEHCRLYLFEAHIRGGCPHCGAETGGYCCEDCGRPNDSDLADPVCTHCGNPPVQRFFKRLYFPLGRYEKELRDFYLQVGMNTHLRALLERVLAAGAPDMPVTHVADWGFPVPLPGYEGQVLSVWFETAPRYLAYARELAGRGRGEGGWERYWKASGKASGKDGEARVYQCFGCDNGFLYGMFIPALLLAFDSGIRLPAAYVMNEFYRLDDLKFSTTRQHAIWARAMLAEVPRDLVRFYLASTRPETDSTNFTMAEFEEAVDRQLIGTWQAWLAELGARIEGERGGEVPWTGDWTEEHRRFYQRLEDLIADAAEGYEARTFSLQRVTRALDELVRTARRFAKGEEHWRGVASRSEERRTSLALEVLAAKALAVAVSPIMPEFAARLWHDLGFDMPLAEVGWEERPAWVAGGQKLRGLGGPYFTSLKAPAEEPAAALAMVG